MTTSDAWLLSKGPKHASKTPDTAQLTLGQYPLGDLLPDDVLVEPIYGCWEGNMTHALQRQPVDICRFRREEQVVLGNAGVARVLQAGSEVKGFHEGQMCMIFGNAEPDEAGYMVKALAYDAVGTMGMLAKRSKVKAHNLIPLPENTRFSLPQWAAFSLRYVTAWSNWRLAWTLYRAQMPEETRPHPAVVAWGGGVAFAQLQLARTMGCRSFMFASRDARIEELHRHGINAIDRRAFPDIEHDKERYRSDLDYKKRYIQSEKAMLHTLQELTQQAGVDVFFDHIGGPLFNATLKSLGRQGVVASAGWKLGADITETSRSTECIQRHSYINTHYAKYQEGLDAVAFGEAHDWMPPENLPIYAWEDIPKLTEDYAANTIDSYFPIYQVNPA